jgi:energy-coupling factor transporter ATP-binding protein EcfA2
MSLHVCVLGIDGSGKSTVVAALPGILAAETGCVVGAAGDSFCVVAPDEDHLASRFHPDGLPVSARLSLKLRRFAKSLVDHSKLYAFFKVAQMLSQDSAAAALARRYDTKLFVSDGNAVLSTAGRASNYLRAASAANHANSSAPEARDLQAVFSYIFDNAPVPAESSAKLPSSLRKGKLIYKFSRFLRLNTAWLPDVVIFLDLSPELALTRIKDRGKKIDRHENLADLTQAREMYLKTVNAFQEYRSPQLVHVIRVDQLSLGATLRAVSEVLRPHLISHTTKRESASPLGTTDLADETIRGKTLNHRYLFRYLVPKWFSGAWREPTFFFSRLGRLFLKEGYSAGVMRAIYDRDEKKHGVLDRIFLEYSLHRAVYDRLQILVKKIEPEIEARLAAGQELRIFTAPSGFAYDLFRPLAEIALRDPESMKRVHLTAADLDPHGVIHEELSERAKQLGIGFTFHRGDITGQTMLSRLEETAPFDLALFVGLSSWLPKPQTLRHLAWLSKNLKHDGLLVTDCFTPEAYALSGRYIGYKANYYTAEVYKATLSYCGFDVSAIESGRDAINHVLIACPRPEADPPAIAGGTDLLQHWGQTVYDARHI